MYCYALVNYIVIVHVLLHPPPLGFTFRGNLHLIVLGCECVTSGLVITLVKQIKMYMNIYFFG